MKRIDCKSNNLSWLEVSSYSRCIGRHQIPSRIDGFAIFQSSCHANYRAILAHCALFTDKYSLPAAWSSRRSYSLFRIASDCIPQFPDLPPSSTFHILTRLNHPGRSIMGVEPPFLYDPPTKQHSSPYGGGFNPKIVSQASLVAPKPRPKQDGPLVNFNKHP